MARIGPHLHKQPEELDVNSGLPSGEQDNSRSEEAQDAGENAANPAHNLEILKAERDALRDRAARLQAEFENARRRDRKEREEFKEFALADALKSLLPALDSFDRALQSPPENLPEFRSGVELIRKQLHDALERLGLRPVPAQGERFDPRWHQALETSVNEAVADDQVLDELQRGYILGERLLRPAMVRVARNPSRQKVA